MDAAVLIGAKALDKSSSAALTYLILLRFVLMIPIGIAGLVIGATRYGGIGEGLPQLHARKACSRQRFARIDADLSSAQAALDEWSM